MVDFGCRLDNSGWAFDIGTLSWWYTLGNRLAGFSAVRQRACDRAEIDIIAQKEKNILVIVEVKTRNSDYFGDPQDFVKSSKIKLLVKAANEYVISNDLDVEVQFDIIAVIKNKSIEKIEHFKNAFYHF